MKPLWSSFFLTLLMQRLLGWVSTSAEFISALAWQPQGALAK